jgi:hypothetical protein
VDFAPAGIEQAAGRIGILKEKGVGFDGKGKDKTALRHPHYGRSKAPFGS